MSTLITALALHTAGEPVASSTIYWRDSTGKLLQIKRLLTAGDVAAYHRDAAVLRRSLGGADGQLAGQNSRQILSALADNWAALVAPAALLADANVANLADLTYAFDLSANSENSGNTPDAQLEAMYAADHDRADHYGAE